LYSRFLKLKFPQLFDPAPEPKILITTSLNASIHGIADVLTSLFPNSEYIRRSAHVHGHKYSIREIAQYATNRGYSALVVLMQAEHEKKVTETLVEMLVKGN
jgi:ribosome production factor 1